MGEKHTGPKATFTRKYFTGPDNTKLSYIDYGGDGPPLLALHGHMNEGRFVQGLADAIHHEYRVVALDQRGHGESERPTSYANDRYVDDALAWMDELGLQKAIILGHSLGGVVAYRLAAKQPRRVAAMIVEDVGAVVDSDLSFVAEWPRRAPTREALCEAMGRLGPPHLYSMRQYDDGWGLPFEAEDMIISTRETNGDHWSDWLATDLPALLLHGTRSVVLSCEHAEEMARRRPNTTLVHMDAGHAIYYDNLDAYVKAIRDFLTRIQAD
ncbi:alpha/beta fold hydrolase [Lihuaxuella thermophila]|uniref:Pimeloyl-ACP methyl ester carboxylesterase n=1 Tax=Lihuaxuella thermophila TaxID=1173111 RepID=A0A1H8CSU8_9BACL|nr:alpha/beta hydrolase [Lihuaxuella thermophila]SEM98086.1 Pimeloyl-ACP methyl ester carboxylesterase [Lihuaxuella thermophila]